MSAGIHPTQLLRYVIRPTLAAMGTASAAAEALLLGTAAVESQLGRYLHQAAGPALGIYQMEPATHDDLWRHWLPARPVLRTQLLTWAADTGVLPPPADQLIHDLRYATAMARLHYLRVPAPLPPAADLPALAEYWKRHYNTHLGRGTPEKFLRAWAALVAPAAP